ncbi:hypothetical protein PPERSA_12292 [Pseudocohnilembus persalinus]|uniref:Uncharacterized protein n=1 Tax=Pseudocohnilembus persalinus TaxID=266149 RepID=A0A0V0R4Y6_PSEPJ|nr:hypothetical protein PPERSA_12292 [Pseudocohnilembus persalinus]|eukprot:KRX09549.1 hypothetical protein PPERSA_12292 [Pseudocohnilembus persalinus]
MKNYLDHLYDKVKIIRQSYKNIKIASTDIQIIYNVDISQANINQKSNNYPYLSQLFQQEFGIIFPIIQADNFYGEQRGNDSQYQKNDLNQDNNQVIEQNKQTKQQEDLNFLQKFEEFRKNTKSNIEIGLRFIEEFLKNDNIYLENIYLEINQKKKSAPNIRGNQYEISVFENYTHKVINYFLKICQD